MSLLSMAERSAAANRPPPNNQGQEGFQPKGGGPQEAADSALKRLVEFIPVETVAAYWIAVPAAALLAGESVANKAVVVGGPLVTPSEAHPNGYDWLFFLVLLAATPLLLLLQYLAKLPRNKGGPLPGWKTWPWWPMLVSAVAFVAWSMAIPGNPFLHTPGRLMTASLGAVLVSAVLVSVDRIVNPPVS